MTQGRETRESTPCVLDRLVIPALVIGVALVVIDVVWAFTLAPLVQGAQLTEPVVIAGRRITTLLLLSQKIFYLHVPVAVASFVVMFFAAFHSVRLLMTGKREHDVLAKTAMEVTLVFVAATMISGDLWTCFEWGTWWTWEPRLTTYFILTLLVIGYFILRNAFDDPERRARFAAVFCIVAFIDAPISFFITRLVPASSIHPVVFRTDSGLPPLMLIPFLLGLFGMLLVAFGIYRIACRVNRDAAEVEDLKAQLEEQDARGQRQAAADALDRLRAASAQVVVQGDAASRDEDAVGDGSPQPHPLDVAVSEPVAAAPAAEADTPQSVSSDSAPSEASEPEHANTASHSVTED